MRFLKFILTFTLFLSAFAGDYVVFKSKYSDSIVFRAVTDILVHGVIGLLSATLFFSYRLNVTTEACILNIMFCTVISSLIDIDHVFVAKSFYIKDLTNLNQRGIFHCTTFWIVVTTVSFVYSYLARKINLYVVTFMLILAFTSHHVRDGNRRGLWLYPYGHTSPINKYLYASLLAVLPNIFANVFVFLKRDYKENVVEYISIIYMVVLLHD